MAGFWDEVGSVAAMIFAIPVVLAGAGFGLYAFFHPNDTAGQTERGANLMQKSVENEIPAWATPADAIPVFLLAILIVGGMWAWRRH